MRNKDRISKEEISRDVDALGERLKIAFADARKNAQMSLIKQVVAISDLPKTIYGKLRDVEIESGVLRIYYLEMQFPTKYTFFAMEKGNTISPYEIYDDPVLIRSYGDVDIFLEETDYFTD